MTSASNTSPLAQPHRRAAPAPDDPSHVRTERERILAEYRRRTNEVPVGRYAATSPAEMHMRQERSREAVRLLHQAGRFPMPHSRCLEVGCGRLGWLGELTSWGIPTHNISGIDLDAERASQARRAFEGAEILEGDATSLPWNEASFDLVILSTVVSSILDPRVRSLVCREARRVLHHRGALVWYDLRRDNPKNPAVRRVSAAELEELFPGCRIHLRAVTLAPPILRRILGREPGSWRRLLVAASETLPVLRTHWVAIIEPSEDPIDEGGSP